MSNVGHTVSEFISAVGETYGAIDIRSVAIRKDDSWLNCMAVIRLTYEDVDTAKARLAKLSQRFPPVQTKLLRIDSFVRPFKDFPDFCLELGQKGVLQMDGIEFQLRQKPDLFRDSGYIQWGYSRLRPFDGRAWPAITKEFDAGGNSTLFEGQFNREAHLLGYGDVFEAANALCELSVSLQQDRGCDLSICFPVFADISGIQVGHLAQIAANTQRPVTQAQRNAETLRRHIGACVSVTEGNGSWPSTPLIVEVSDANIATLFTPSAGSNPQASCVQVDCGELEISEIPHGSCPLWVHVRRRYGPAVQLGEIRRWEDRNLPAAAPRFSKGGNVYQATFSKEGSAETRSLHIYASADGSNSFLLEPSVGEQAIADNVEISRRFMLLEVNYRAAGFKRSGSGTGGSPHPLFIW